MGLFKLEPEEFDEWFPTFIRYAGAGIIIATTIKLLFFGGVEYPSLYVAATGMILYKEIVKSRNTKSKDDNDKRDLS